MTILSVMQLMGAPVREDLLVSVIYHNSVVIKLLQDFLAIVI